MPVYMCRREDGSLSFVAAPNKKDAALMLDEFDSVGPEHLTVVKKFMVDFRLNDEGELEPGEGFGAQCELQIDKQYPLVEAVYEYEHEVSKEEFHRMLAEAVAKERERVQ